MLRACSRLESFLFLLTFNVFIKLQAQNDVNYTILENSLKEKKYKQFNHLIDSLYDIKTYSAEGRFLCLAADGFWQQFLDTDSSKTWLKYAYLMKSRQYYDEAYLHSKAPWNSIALKKIDSLHLPLCIKQAEMYMIQGKNEQYLEELIFYLKYKPQDTLYQKRLLALYFKQKKWDSLLVAAKKILPNTQFNSIYFYVLKANKDINKLEKYCDSVLSKRPLDSLCFANKIAILAKNRSLKIQKQYADSVIKILPPPFIIKLYEDYMLFAYEKDSLKQVEFWYAKLDSLPDQIKVLKKDSKILYVLGLSRIKMGKNAMLAVDVMDYPIYLKEGRALERKAKDLIRNGLSLLRTYERRYDDTSLEWFISQVESQL